MSQNLSALETCHDRNFISENTRCMSVMLIILLPYYKVAGLKRVYKNRMSTAAAVASGNGNRIPVKDFWVELPFKRACHFANLGHHCRFFKETLHLLIVILAMLPWLSNCCTRALIKYPLLLGIEKHVTSGHYVTRNKSLPIPGAS